MSEHSITSQAIADALITEKSKNGYKSKQYKAISNELRGEQISQSVHNKSSALRQSIAAPRVNLSDTEAVQERTFIYLDACEIAQCLPSVMGLSGAMGCSRQNLNQWLLAHPEHQTTNFINMVKDLMANILTESSLCNDINPVMAIFTLKNHFEHADRVEIAPVVNNQFGCDEYSADEIRKRYLPPVHDKVND